MTDSESEASGRETEVALSEESIDAADSYGGECQEDRPYAKTFTVIREGVVWMSCTHSSPHEHRLT